MARDFLTAALVLGVMVQLAGGAWAPSPPASESPPTSQPTPGNQPTPQPQTPPGTQIAPGNQNAPANQTAPGNQTAGNVAPVAPVDPAAVMFTTESGMVLHAVKPASVADYEAAMVALQDAFAKSTDEEVKRVASGWRIWKAAEPDSKANVIYVHMLVPTAADVDYRPSLWLDQLLAGAPPDLLAKYRDSFAAPPSKLSLTAFAHMAVAPAPPANASPGSPATATPAKPGNGSPH